MYTQRYLFKHVKADIEKKMVFIGGPRQVGKTTFSKHITKEFAYLNWDNGEHRELILRGEIPNKKLVILDELHKYRPWRNWIKGKFDTLRETHQFLVTGSARLDLYRFGGDSLQGRYFYYRLHPLSIKELGIHDKTGFQQLLNLSGFPEPYFEGSEREYKRWTKDYRNRFFKEDLTPIEYIEDLGTLELLALRLPDLVGSPLSINSLREDLQKSHKTISRWLDIFERLYGIFRISPFGAPKIRAVKKEQKHYHFDWALCPDAPKRIENLVACHLLKMAHFLEDTEGDTVELRYFRDQDGREVDFVFVKNKKPTHFIEVKQSAREISGDLRYLKKKFPAVTAVQLHTDEKTDFIDSDGIRSCPVWKFFDEFEQY